MDLSKTMLIGSYSSTCTVAGPIYHDTFTLTSTTNVRIQRGSSTYATPYHCFVIRWIDATTVQYGVKTVTVGTSNALRTTTQAITPVDDARSIFIPTYNCPPCYGRTSHTSANTGRTARGRFLLDSGGAGWTIHFFETNFAFDVIWSWQVIQFEYGS